MVCQKKFTAGLEIQTMFFCPCEIQEPAIGMNHCRGTVLVTSNGVEKVWSPAELTPIELTARVYSTVWPQADAALKCPQYILALKKLTLNRTRL